jgi:hypothetical protein
MKAIRVIIATIALAAVLAACGEGNPDIDGSGSENNPKEVTYSGISGFEIYSLRITGGATRADYTPQSGDRYVLTGGGKISNGTVVSWAGNTLTLSSESAEFTATVSDSDIVRVSGSVNWTMPDGSKVIEVVNKVFDTSDDDDDNDKEGEAIYWQNWIGVQKAQGYTEGWPSAALQAEYSVGFNNEGAIKLYLHSTIREELYFLKVGSISNFDDLMSQVNSTTWEQIHYTAEDGFRYVVYRSTDERHTGSIEASYMASPYSVGIIEITVGKIEEEE